MGEEELQINYIKDNLIQIKIYKRSKSYKGYDTKTELSIIDDLKNKKSSIDSYCRKRKKGNTPKDTSLLFYFYFLIWLYTSATPAPTKPILDTIIIPAEDATETAVRDTHKIALLTHFINHSLF